MRPGWILTSLSTLPKGQGRASQSRGGVAGRPVHFCADFSLQFFRFNFFLPVNEQNQSEALRWGGGRTTSATSVRNASKGVSACPDAIPRTTNPIASFCQHRRINKSRHVAAGPGGRCGRHPPPPCGAPPRRSQRSRNWLPSPVCRIRQLPGLDSAKSQKSSLAAPSWGYIWGYFR